MNSETVKLQQVLDAVETLREEVGDSEPARCERWKLPCSLTGAPRRPHLRLLATPAGIGAHRAKNSC